MTPANLVTAIDEAIPHLLKLARSLTWNRISDNCLFIISEITDEPTDARQRQRLTKRLNEAKNPLPLADLTPKLHQLYDNLYDINLYIYRATREVTVVDIRYYPRSSLSLDYQKKVADAPPMMHLKVNTPPWVGIAEPQPKFDINWERQTIWAWWRTWWFRYRLRN